MRPATAVANAPSRTGPDGSASPAASRRAASSSSRMRIARGRSRAPAGVSVAPARPRANSGRPAISSSVAIWREIADCV